MKQKGLRFNTSEYNRFWFVLKATYFFNKRSISLFEQNSHILTY